jgi:hypothetical protein
LEAALRQGSPASELEPLIIQLEAPMSQLLAALGTHLALQHATA